MVKAPMPDEVEVVMLQEGLDMDGKDFGTCKGRLMEPLCVLHVGDDIKKLPRKVNGGMSSGLLYCCCRWKRTKMPTCAIVECSGTKSSVVRVPGDPHGVLPQK